MLPRLDPEIPQVMKLRRMPYGLADLAEAMLAEHILKESDWTGDVRASLRSGLGRWVDMMLGGEPLRRIYLVINWTNELGEGMNPTLWLQAQGQEVPQGPTEPIGLLSLMGPRNDGGYDDGRDVFVRETVLALEAHRPGLGFQVLGLLQDVAGVVLQALCPGTAYHHLETDAALRREWLRLAAQRGEALSFEAGARVCGLTPPRHGLAMDDLLRVVPREACCCEPPAKTGLIHSALRAGTPAGLRPVLAAAAELDQCRQLPESVLRCDTPLFLDTRFSPANTPGGCLKEPPFCIRWTAEDPIARIAADYCEILRSRDAATNLIWLRAWRVSSGDQLRRAVREWKQVLRVALKTARLAEMMHREAGDA